MVRILRWVRRKDCKAWRRFGVPPADLQLGKGESSSGLERDSGAILKAQKPNTSLTFGGVQGDVYYVPGIICPRNLMNLIVNGAPMVVIPGDFNHDGRVDLVDFATFANNFSG